MNTYIFGDGQIRVPHSPEAMETYHNDILMGSLECSPVDNFEGSQTTFLSKLGEKIVGVWGQLIDSGAVDRRLDFQNLFEQHPELHDLTEGAEQGYNQGIMNGHEQEGPSLTWLDLEEAFARAHRMGEQSIQYLEQDGNSELLKLYLRNEPYNLMLGRPLFPEDVPEILFWIQVTAPSDRNDIPRQLYAALPDDDRLFFLRDDILENAGRPKTDEILEMVRQAHLIPVSEYTDDV